MHADVFSIPVDSKKPAAFSADLVPNAFVGGSENRLAKHVYTVLRLATLFGPQLCFLAQRVLENHCWYAVLKFSVVNVL